MTPNADGASPATIAQALAAITSELTPQERKAADHLVAHYPVAGLAPMARFARSAGASSQTVLRLLAKLGMTNWRTLQDRLRTELAAERGSPLGRWTAHRAEAGGEAGDRLQSFGEHLAVNVQTAFRDLDRAKFETAAQRLADPRRQVLVVGGRFSQALARLAVRHLEIVRGGVEEIGSLSSTWPDRLIDVGRRSTILAYDVRRYQPDVVRLCRFAAERGASIVLLTDDLEAPAAEFAEAVLVGQTGSAGAWDSFTSLVALTEALLARVTELSSHEASDRLARLEQIRARVLEDE